MGYQLPVYGVVRVRLVIESFVHRVRFAADGPAQTQPHAFVRPQAGEITRRDAFARRLLALLPDHRRCVMVLLSLYQ